MKLYALIGPTATGKTELALAWATAIRGEIVSLDSRQVYQSLDIGTGKDVLGLNPHPSKLRLANPNISLSYYLKNGIRIWLYDLVKPSYAFNVADYVRSASVVVQDILSRGNQPIFVGGTGLYLRALLDGFPTLFIPPDPALRQELAAIPLAQLQTKLKAEAPTRFNQLNQSDRSNPRRLVRALELVRSHSQVPSSPALHFDQLKLIGLTAPQSVLTARIDRRIQERLAAGLLPEIKGLLALGYTWQNSALGSTLGYREWETYFTHQASLTEVLTLWKNHEHHYAKRQLTWFKPDVRITWLDITKMPKKPISQIL